ncbi:MAG: ribonuclease J [Ndongobacter sp.]|nr:ribonuclease J [Ndongobacter sp.]
MRKKTTIGQLKVIPLGGLGEIGKNMTAVEYKDDILIIDCGLTFPTDEMPGVDIVIPDITYLEQNREKIRGILLTHGHEDHYGAVPYVLKKLHTKVYCTRLTGGMLENKFKEHGQSPDVIRYVSVGEKLVFGAFQCEFIRVAHSIPDACAIAVFNPVGTLLFTGDFKFDFTPIDGQPTDIHRLAELGKEGVLCMFADSTNVERPGFTMSERKVGETFTELFSRAKDRIIVATFASNLHRVQQVITASEAVHRKVCLSGRSMLNNVAVAVELGYLKVRKGTLIDINELKNFKPHQTTLLITGTQGEPMSALTRIAKDEHRKITLTEKDTVVLSASEIPGNERNISDVINNIMAHGSTVLYSALAEVHVSGHARQEELKLMHSLVRPQYFIPAHGEQRMLISHKRLAESMGMKSDHILLGANGTVFEFQRHGHKVTGKINGQVQAGNVLVDGLGIGDVGSIVLKDRKHLSDDGMIAIVVSVDRKSRRVAAGPEIVSRGFVYMKDNVDLIEGIKKTVSRIFQDAEKRHISDWNFLKSQMREQVKSYVYTEIHRDPMILSIIMEVDCDNAKTR